MNVEIKMTLLGMFRLQNFGSVLTEAEHFLVLLEASAGLNL